MKLQRAATIGGVVAFTVVTDQVTKVVAREALEGEPTRHYLGDTFRLTFIENHGAFLGLGGNLPESARTLIFTVLVSIMLVAFMVWVWRSPNLSRLAIVASSLVVGGGIGNLIDRVTNNGGVVDFLNLGIGGLRTGIFNLADVWIVVGGVLIFFSSDFREKDASEKGDTPDGEPDEPDADREVPEA